MMTIRNSLKPLEPPYPPSVQALLDTYPTRHGYLLKLFRVFANSERFLRKGTLNLLDRDSPLSLREREIVILRVCANNHCEYEWGVHVTAFAEHGGFTQTQIDATYSDQATAPCWTPKEQVLISVVDELCEYGKLQAVNLEALQSHWSGPEQLEIFALCGNYHTISFVANNTDLTAEDFAASFPAKHAANTSQQ